MKIIVTAAVVECDGRFLVTKRQRGVHLEGFWEFPGGKCEPGEDRAACLAREIREELAVEARVGDELLATKLRALYQRRKGRDLFDLWIGLGMKEADPARIADAFRKYMSAAGGKVSRREFEKNLEAKVTLRQCNDDLRPLLAPAIRYAAGEAARAVKEKLLSKL